MHRVVGDQPDRAAVDARQRGDDAGAEAGAQLERRARVDERVDDGADVVAAQAVGRQQRSQRRRVGGLPWRRCGPGRTRDSGEPTRDAFGLVADEDVDHAGARLHVARADLLGLEDAEAAAFDHRRPAHADRAVARRDDDVAAAEQRGVAGEAAAGDDADQRHPAAQAREAREGRDVQAGDDRHVDVAGPAAAALGEEHHRQALLARDLEQPVGLLVVAHALRAGEDGRVVGHDDGARSLGAERLAVDAADAGDHAVGRRVADQVVELAPAALRRERERAVLDEAAGVAEIGDVLARGAQAEGVSLGDGVGPAGVGEQRLARAQLEQIGAQGVRVGSRRGAVGGRQPVRRPGAASPAPIPPRRHRRRRGAAIRPRRRSAHGPRAPSSSTRRPR